MGLEPHHADSPGWESGEWERLEVSCPNPALALPIRFYVQALSSDFLRWHFRPKGNLNINVRDPPENEYIMNESYQ